MPAKPDEPLIAWRQEPLGREVYEIIGAPFWVVDMPYLKNWRRPRWLVPVLSVEHRFTSIYGTEQFDVRDLHPMNATTREFLRIREDRPESPFVTPKVTVPHGR